MVGVSASVNLPLHYKVQKFSSGTLYKNAHFLLVHRAYVVCDVTQVYLVDYGLAYRYIGDGGRRTEYKEDPRRTHDGTIEFTSRDAHRGVRKRIFINHF